MSCYFFGCPQPAPQRVMHANLGLVWTCALHDPVKHGMGRHLPPPAGYGRDDVFRVERRPGDTFHVVHLAVAKRDAAGKVLTVRRCCEVDVVVTAQDRRETSSQRAAEVQALARANQVIDARHV